VRPHAALFALATLLLAACGAPPRHERVGAGDWPAPTAAPPAPAAPVPGSGGYYADDGPAARTPRDLDSIPDAVPRWEPISRGNARPYEVLGRRYVPFTTHRPYRERGIASWYGKKFHGNLTANGERYDMFAMSAAHPTLPLPSYVRVTHVANGRSVVVRVNDRGPFHAGRIIDLSYAAAHRLDLIGRGSGEVIVEAILPGSGSGTDFAQAGAPPTAPSAPAAATAAPVVEALTTLSGSGSPPISDNASPGYYVQLGAFGNADNAVSLHAHLSRELDWLDRPVGIYRTDGVHRVQIGPYPQRADADRVAARIGAALGVEPAIAIR
jgi:rare lipoprotein A